MMDAEHEANKSTSTGPHLGIISLPLHQEVAKRRWETKWETTEQNH